MVYDIRISELVANYFWELTGNFGFYLLIQFLSLTT